MRSCVFITQSLFLTHTYTNTRTHTNTERKTKRQPEREQHTHANTKYKHCMYTYFLFHPDIHTHMSLLILMGAAARLPACLCGVLTSLFVSSCAGWQAGNCSRRPRRCGHG